MVDLASSKGKQMVHCESLSLNQIYASKLNEEGERTRIEKLELFERLVYFAFYDLID